ncbi:unnamed protein product [Arctia plantaginis]|uniref:Uncharacterized protein n=1 Tax=Arctia plantaginis TaxID=874455 RepID=A0A8S1AST9_ARCPL|nr:unnamed protein product [Arctia plantaginis]CAB3250220.1 unnamed protein product [Arctia plantaginis]
MSTKRVTIRVFRVDDGEAVESTMSCKLRPAVACARRVRASSIAASDAPRRRLLPSTPAASLALRTVAPRALAPRPNAFTTRLPRCTHTYSKIYLSTITVCSHT